VEPPVEAKQERDREHEPERAEQQLAARTGKQRGSGKRADVMKHVRRHADQHTPGCEDCGAKTALLKPCPHRSAPRWVLSPE